MITYAFVLHTCAPEYAFCAFFPAAAQKFPFCAPMLTEALQTLHNGRLQPVSQPFLEVGGLTAPSNMQSPSQT